MLDFGPEVDRGEYFLARISGGEIRGRAKGRIQNCIILIGHAAHN